MSKQRVQNIIGHLGVRAVEASDLQCSPTSVKSAALNSKEKFSLDLFRIDGRVALVTGASKGIGRELARALASVGASVIITSRNFDEITATARELSEETKQSVVGVRSDATVETDVINAIEECINHFGRLDILVNNAGGAPAPIEDHLLPLEDTPVEAFVKVVALNFIAAFVHAKHALKHLKKHKVGRIINISTALVPQHAPGVVSYVSAKAGMEKMTKVLALELGTSGVTANIIEPGVTDTPSLRWYLDTMGATKEQFAEQLPIPFGRVADVRELTGAVVYLASDLGSYTTGATLNVSGGIM